MFVVKEGKPCVLEQKNYLGYNTLTATASCLFSSMEDQICYGKERKKKWERDFETAEQRLVKDRKKEVVVKSLSSLLLCTCSFQYCPMSLLSVHPIFSKNRFIVGRGVVYDRRAKQALTEWLVEKLCCHVRLWPLCVMCHLHTSITHRDIGLNGRFCSVT